MAKKKSQNANQVQNGKVGPKQVDPPVIVGGGGSVNIDFKNSPSNGTAQPGYARRNRIPENITRVLISDGITGKIHDIPVHPERFTVNFKIS